MKKELLITSLLSILGIGLFLSSCDKQKDIEGEHRTHIAVQLESGGPWSIADKDGNIVARDVYPNEVLISDVYDGVYWVKFGNSKFVLYNVNEPDKPLCDTCIAATEFATGRSVVVMKGKPLLIINTSGKIVEELSEDYCVVSSFNNDGMARYKGSSMLNGCGIIDRDGDVVYENYIDDIVPYSLNDGVAILNDFNIISYDGEHIGRIDLSDYNINYENKPHFSDGLIGLLNNTSKETDYFDKKGIKVFSIERALPMDFHDGFAISNTVDGSRIIDKEGNILLKTNSPYEKIYHLTNGKFIKEVSGDYCAIIDAQGNELFKIEDANDIYNVIMMGGDRFLLCGGSHKIYNMEGKRMSDVSFRNISRSPCPANINYVNPKALASHVIHNLEDQGTLLTNDKKTELLLRTSKQQKAYLGKHSKGFSLDSILYGMPYKVSYGFDKPFLYWEGNMLRYAKVYLTQYSQEFLLGDFSNPPTVDRQELVEALKNRLILDGFEDLGNGHFTYKAEGKGNIRKNVKVSVSDDYSRAYYLYIGCTIELPDDI